MSFGDVKNERMKNYNFLLKIVMAGDCGVGKTQLLTRFTRNMFLEESRSTIGAEFASRVIDVEIQCGKLAKRVKKKAKLQIWDTAGQERYRALTRSFYRGAVGVLLVFNVCSKRTFKHLGRWLEEIEEYSDRDPVILIAANQIDMPASKHKTQSATSSGYAEQRDVMFFEMSAKSGKNVDDAFAALAQRIMNTKPEVRSNNVDDAILLPDPVGRSSKCC